MNPRRAGWWRFYAGGEYVFRGRDIRTGVDCWSLWAIVLREEFGRTVSDFGDLYPSEGGAGVDEARAAIRSQLPGFAPCEWEEGAGVLFNVAGRPTHIAVATATPGLVLHAHPSCGVDLLDAWRSPRWRSRFVGCWLPR